MMFASVLFNLIWKVLILGYPLAKSDLFLAPTAGSENVFCILLAIYTI